MKGKFPWQDVLLVALRAALVAVAALLADHMAGGELTRLALVPARLVGVPVALPADRDVSSSKSYNSSLYVPGKWSISARSQLVPLA